MNDDKTQDLELISAFVDGELEPTARAEVLRKAAGDPAYARELIARERLKATLKDSFEVPEIELPTLPHRRWNLPAISSIAASLALLVAAALVWIVYNGSNEGRSVLVHDQALNQAIVTHRTWAADTGQQGETATARPASAKIDAYVPDLSANGLNIGHVSEQVVSGGNNTLVVGYIGSRGCRVTLLVSHTAGRLPEHAVYMETGPVRAIFWRTEQLAYRMLAEGMATPRFRLIADSVRRASLNHLPLNAETRLAMEQSRAESSPCAV